MDKMTDSRAAEAQAQGGGEPYCYVLAGMHETVTGEVNFLCNRERKTDADIPLYTAPPSAPVGVEGPKAYCRECNAAGMRNCANFDECGGARCITCHQQLNQLAQQPAAVDGAAIRYALEHARDLDDGVLRVLAALAAQPGGSDHG